MAMSKFYRKPTVPKKTSLNVSGNWYNLMLGSLVCFSLASFGIRSKSSLLVTFSFFLGSSSSGGVVITTKSAHISFSRVSAKSSTACCKVSWSIDKVWELTSNESTSSEVNPNVRRSFILSRTGPPLASSIPASSSPSRPPTSGPAVAVSGVASKPINFADVAVSGWIFIACRISGVCVALSFLMLVNAFSHPEKTCSIVTMPECDPGGGHPSAHRTTVWKRRHPRWVPWVISHMLSQWMFWW